MTAKRVRATIGWAVADIRLGNELISVHLCEIGAERMMHKFSNLSRYFKIINVLITEVKRKRKK